MTAELDPNVAVFVAIPLERAECSSSEMETEESAEAALHQTPTRRRQKKPDDSSALLWMFLGVVVVSLIFNLSCLVYSSRPRPRSTLTVTNLKYNSEEGSTVKLILRIEQENQWSELEKVAEQFEVEQHAVELTLENFDKFVKDTPNAFVNFYMPWGYSKNLRPTWQRAAQTIQEMGLPIAVGQVDCVAHEEICSVRGIRMFPTMLWFHDGVMQPPHYEGDHTVSALVGYAKYKLARSENKGLAMENTGLALSNRVAVANSHEQPADGQDSVKREQQLEEAEGDESSKEIPFVPSLTETSDVDSGDNLFDSLYAQLDDLVDYGTEVVARSYSALLERI